MSKRVGGFINQDGLNAPNSATGVSGTAGDQQVDVSFTAPTDEGGAAVIGYRVTDTTGAHGASGSASPITVTGLTNGTSYTFSVWSINPFGWSSPSDASGSVTPFGARAIFGSYSNMKYVSIGTLGNAVTFGNLSVSGSKNGRAACSSSSRAVFGGGEVSSTPSNVLEYVAFATTGDSTDFGDLTVARYDLAGASSSTRGLFASGSTLSANTTVDYITIASTGNATDFGDNGGVSGLGGLASPTRAVFGGGVSSGTSVTTTMEYVTIATTGNSAYFGGLTQGRAWVGGASNSTRGLFGAGYNWSIGPLNVIDYITIASTGSATDFGDLTAGRFYAGGAASSTRALFASTQGSPSTLDYVTISSTGNALDFGDIALSGNGVAGCSSAHGGLS